MSQNVNSWGTVQTNNYDQKCEDTKKYGPHRVDLGLYVKKVLNDQKVSWWLDTGNLMGAYRDGKMIKHDDDFDIGVLATKEQFEALFSKMEKNLDAKYKMRMISTYCNKMEVYDPAFGDYILDPVNNYNYHNVTVDIQLYTRQQNGKVHMCYTKNNLCDFIHLNEDFILPTSEIAYEGQTFSAPKDPKKYLEAHYGYLGYPAVYNAQTRKYEEKKVEAEEKPEEKKNE